MQVRLAPSLQLMMTHSRVVHQTTPLQGQMLRAIPLQVCTQLCNDCSIFGTCQSAVHRTSTSSKQLTFTFLNHAEDQSGVKIRHAPRPSLLNFDTSQFEGAHNGQQVSLTGSLCSCCIVTILQCTA